ncbi:hypothetical protein B0H11DRAFT_1928682 [Mycena galericulata]|nr:hypothetical protein B0H11DRAFT_1928682 [Mycena galericulata]
MTEKQARGAWPRERSVWPSTGAHLGVMAARPEATYIISGFPDALFLLLLDFLEVSSGHRGRSQTVFKEFDSQPVLDCGKWQISDWSGTEKKGVSNHPIPGETWHSVAISERLPTSCQIADKAMGDRTRAGNFKWDVAGAGPDGWGFLPQTPTAARSCPLAAGARCAELSGAFLSVAGRD